MEEDGAVDEMRSRLRSYLDKCNMPKEHEALIEKIRSTVEMTENELRVSYSRNSRTTSPANVKEKIEPRSENLSDTCDKVRKWGVKYDGGKDPLSFLERVDELAACYSIPRQTLLNLMPELLKEDALSWYRNNKDEWKTYNDFLDDFKLFHLPARFFENLEDDIKNRKQQADENFVSYVTSIQSLMRVSNLSNHEQLERIYTNCCV